MVNRALIIIYVLLYSGYSVAEDKSRSVGPQLDPNTGELIINWERAGTEIVRGRNLVDAILIVDRIIKETSNGFCWFRFDQESRKVIDRADLRGSNLEHAELPNVILNGVNFAGANLQHASLPGAHLNGAILTDARMARINLCGASLVAADLTSARLRSARLKGADFQRARLEGCILSGARLPGANLSYANLRSARLDETKLHGADFRYSDISNANLEAAIAPLTLFNSAIMQDCRLYNTDLRRSNIRGVDLRNSFIEGAYVMQKDFEGVITKGLMGVPRMDGLKSMRSKDPSFIAALRVTAKNSGRREAERQLTLALNRNESEELLSSNRPAWDSLVSYGRYLFFDLTSEYGASPWRPIGILASVIVFCALCYALSFGHSSRHQGIWIQYPTGENIAGPFLLKAKWKCQDKPVIRHAICTGIWFSLLSAFNIGFRDLNVSRWLAHLQSREYSLVGKGWVRRLSGLQALISVYLLGLWVLTYFGRPFE